MLIACSKLNLPFYALERSQRCVDFFEKDDPKSLWRISIINLAIFTYSVYAQNVRTD